MSLLSGYPRVIIFAKLFYSNEIGLDFDCKVLKIRIMYS